jgi:phage/plasmid-like protein (TIGR03299 family)
MSKETTAWLNTNTLIGFTDKRGKAWHYRASDQGAQSNHYAGPVPVEDVLSRLFYWKAAKGTVTASWITPDGVTSTEDKKRFPVGRIDTGDIFGYFADGYEIHQYRDWLVTQVGNILDDGLGIGSAGLLRNGAQAWVSVEVPDTIRTPEGVEFRPNLLACTSHDGSIATTYKRVVTNVVCDNTMAAGLSENGQQIKIKHSRYSKLKLAEARDALAIMHTVADDFAAQVKALCEIEITPREWSQFLNAHVPMSDADSKKSQTMRANKRAALSRLWNNDNRVTPWKGTAYGVLQAVNTYSHHEATVQGASRPERNMSNAVLGKYDALDLDTVKTLDRVLAGA